jgi:predicted TIM-barrel fold metal-dependent hydrolase
VTGAREPVVNWGVLKMKNNASKSALLRARLNHPVIDVDGHTVEFTPAFFDYLRDVGGSSVVERYRAAGFGFGCAPDWYHLTPAERVRRRAARPPWWALPTRNTLDRATATLPKLLHERLDETGIDFTVLYPSLGLSAPYLEDEEVRRAACRAFNKLSADSYREYADRMTPAAIIPMHTPTEALDELDYAVKTLGLKSIMMASHVIRPIPIVAEEAPSYASYASYIDNFCLDSPYDYDPVWRKCLELKVVPGFHSSGMGWGGRRTSNYMFNHIGHFAAAAEVLCKALFFGGVTVRFPALKFAFLECGVGWACSLFADIVGHWDKRNRQSLENYNPDNLDRRLFIELFERYGGALVADKLDQLRANGMLAGPREDPATLDDFAKCAIIKRSDIAARFVPNFFFGCEADDPVNGLAFDRKKLPFRTKLNAVLSSDIGHWDVPDMRAVLEEAYELVEKEVMTEDDFRDFSFTNPAKMLAGSNADFFKGTVVAEQVASLLTRTSAQEQARL